MKAVMQGTIKYWFFHAHNELCVNTNIVPTYTLEVPMVPISNLSTLVVKLGTISDSLQAQQPSI